MNYFIRELLDFLSFQYSILYLYCMNYKLCAILLTMKANEKKQIYELLNTISDACLGYSSPDFPKNITFLDKNESKIQYPSSNNDLSNDISNSALKFKKEISSFGSGEYSENKMDLKKLSEKVLNCKGCTLSSIKTDCFLEIGIEKPIVMVIVDSLNQNDSSIPFTNEAENLLDKMLNAIELDRKINCYITNTVKCRPPINIKPKKEEILACKSFLDIQIHIMKPKMILVLGNESANAIMNNEWTISQMRQKVFQYKEIPLTVTYNPISLLQNPELKRPAWEDLKFFRSKLMEIDCYYNKKIISHR